MSKTEIGWADGYSGSSSERGVRMTAAERTQRNRRLGDLLGWRTVPRQASTLYGVPGYDVFAPDGTSAGMMVYEVDAGTLYPDFYGSLDACAAVLPGDFAISFDQWVDVEYKHDNVTHKETAEKTITHFVYIKQANDWKGDLPSWSGEGATRSEALAEATLHWALAQKAEAK